MVSWIWQAGGVASRSTPIVNPQDVKGLKVRGGNREMDMVLQAAGATTLSTPSNETRQTRHLRRRPTGAPGWPRGQGAGASEEQSTMV
jgi:hypothetical protein